MVFRLADLLELHRFGDIVAGVLPPDHEYFSQISFKFATSRKGRILIHRALQLLPPPISFRLLTAVMANVSTLATPVPGSEVRVNSD
jgi:hypothetical protein